MTSGLLRGGIAGHGQSRTVRPGFLLHGTVQARARAAGCFLVPSFHRRTGQAAGRGATLVVRRLVRRVAHRQRDCPGYRPHAVMAHGQGRRRCAPCVHATAFWLRGGAATFFVWRARKYGAGVHGLARLSQVVLAHPVDVGKGTVVPPDSTGGPLADWVCSPSFGSPLETR